MDEEEEVSDDEQLECDDVVDEDEDDDDSDLLQAGESLMPESPRLDLKNDHNLIISGIMSSVSGGLQVHTHNLSSNETRQHFRNLLQHEYEQK